jgi:hypothetical protein
MLCLPYGAAVGVVLVYKVRHRYKKQLLESENGKASVQINTGGYMPRLPGARESKSIRMHNKPKGQEAGNEFQSSKKERMREHVK